MKNTEEKLKKIEEYSKWLAEQLDELCISQSELASAVGKSQKTISRYVNGENMPDEAARATIDSYIEECTVFQGFQHIPSKEFSDILLHLLEEFDVSQAKLAKEIGKHQKNISNYICGVEKPDTKTQREILLFFLVNCLSRNITTVHFGTQVQIEYLLFGNFKEWAEKYQFGDKYVTSKCIAFLMTLPTDEQRFIYNNISAFVDSASLDGGSYQSYKSCMELFRKLSPTEKNEIRSELEKDAFVKIPKHEEEVYFFDHIVDYYNVIRSRFVSVRDHDDLFSIGGIEKDKCIFAFESVIEYANVWDDEITDEIQYKLGFHADEWYIWMLFLIYDYKTNNLDALRKRMERKRYPINTSLMLHPQKDK